VFYFVHLRHITITLFSTKDVSLMTCVIREAVVLHPYAQLKQVE